MYYFTCNLDSYLLILTVSVVSMPVSSVVDRGFEPRSGQSIDNDIGICCFSVKNAALRRNPIK